MPILKNQKYEKFIQLIVKGENKGAAYQKVYKAKKSVSEANASRLLRNAQISSRIAELQQKAEDETVLTVLEKRKFCAQVLRTAIGEIDENSPLAQSVEFELITRGQRKGRTVMKLKVVDKIKALEVDSKLAGHFTEKVEVSASDDFAEFLAMLRRSSQ